MTSAAPTVCLMTPRLILRELTEEDLPSLSALLQDEQTMHAYEGAFSNDMVHAWFCRMLERYDSDGYGLWAAINRDTGVMIGQCGLTRQTILDRDVIEVGYLFHHAHWHQGFAVEAASACRDYAFHHVNEHKVWAQVRDTNIASMNVAIRLGMTVRGRFVKHYRGVDMPHLAFAINNPRFTQNA